jgi:hypothetical protein
MRLPQITYFSIGGVILASFTTICALRRPRGYQPAAYGHLQTLASLIDQWPGKGEKMFWGRKHPISAISADLLASDDGRVSYPVDEEEESVHKAPACYHAGTSTNRLRAFELD